MREEDENPELTDAVRHVSRLTRMAYVGAAVACVVLAAYVIYFIGQPLGGPEQWGQFGDYVGGLLNPTFSFLALLALLATLGLQVRELRLSVQELRNSAEALTKQNETLRLQTFEGTFFQLLRLHNDIVNSVEVPHLTLKGRACFARFLDLLERHLEENAAHTNLENFRLHYEFFHVENQAVLGHYFRLLYNVVKLVKNTEGIDKRFYTNLVRAQLSSAEVKLLFYNCLSPWGVERFKPMVEQFALLKTMPNNDLPHESLLHAYAPEAFGGKYPEPWM